MLLGLSKEGLGYVKNLKELVDIASNFEFDVVDTDYDWLKEFVDEYGLNESLRYLEKMQIGIGSVGLPITWRGTDAEFKHSLKELIDCADLTCKIKCKTLFTFFFPSTDEEPLSYLIRLTKRLRICARILAEYDITLALEFVGPLHLREKWKNPFIWRLTDTRDWIEMIGDRNIKLVLDSLHWYSSNGTIQEILNLKPEELGYVHINDARKGPRDLIRDNDRLFPGEGAINLDEFLKAVKCIGYDGILSLEIITPSKSTIAPLELAKKARESLDYFLKIV
jgi:sugar phosphate isomerase/epimerase